MLRAVNDYFCAAMFAFAEEWESREASIAMYGAILIDVERTVNKDIRAAVAAIRKLYPPAAAL